MTTSSNVNNLPVFDFSDDKPATEEYKEQIAEKDILKDAIAKAEAAMAAKSAKKPLVKSKLPSTKKGKAGRIVGISKDENEFIQELLKLVADDPVFGSSHPTYAKIQGRFNK